MASGFVFLPANPELYLHLGSWQVVIGTPATPSHTSITDHGGTSKEKRFSLCRREEGKALRKTKELREKTSPGG
jgi:hypothetical protein